MTAEDRLIEKILDGKLPDLEEKIAKTGEVRFLPTDRYERLRDLINQFKADVCKKQIHDLFSGKLNCECKEDDKTGWTAFHLCNICGYAHKFKEVNLNQLKDK